jgi:imidazole glycerol phosphate synthase subunit HisF
MIFLCVTGGADECARAANIYQCGRDKAPIVTQAMLAAPASKISPVCLSITLQIPKNIGATV